jgi:hypothetical protein
MSGQTDQCALGPDGQLLDAAQIHFFHDRDDVVPLPPSSAPDPSTIQSRGARTRIPAAKITDIDNIAVPSTTDQRKAKLQALADAKCKAAAKSGVDNNVTPTAIPQPPSSSVELILDDSDDEVGNPISTGDKGSYAIMLSVFS